MNATGPTSSTEDGTTNLTSVASGVLLALAAASTLAFGMAIQRYALAHHSNMPPMGRCGKVPRFRAWLCGLLIYGVAQGLFTASLGCGAPLSLLGGVFTTLLLFNLVFAHCLLGELLTWPKIAGALIILIGVSCSSAGTPGARTESDFTTEDISNLLQRSVGSVYFGILIGLTLLLLLTTIIFERRYPHGSAPPPTLDHIMAVLCPAGLGIDEGVTQLTLRATLAMLSKCSAGEDRCDRWVFVLMIVTFVFASFASIWWMRVTFRRYEVVRALPIEYGAVNVAAVGSGLVFYNEASGIETWQLALILSGSAIVLVGIAVSRLGSSNVSNTSADDTTTERKTPKIKFPSSDDLGKAEGAASTITPMTREAMA